MCIRDSVSSPLLASFCLSWVAWNYRFIMVLVSSMPFTEKISYIDTHIFPTYQQVLLQGSLYPLLTALFLIFACLLYTSKEADLPRLCRIRFPQTFVALRAGPAIPQRALELHGKVPVVIAVGAVLVKRFPRRTNAGAGVRVVVEILWPVVAGGLLRMRLVVEGIGPGLVLRLSLIHI